MVQHCTIPARPRQRFSAPERAIRARNGAAERGGGPSARGKPAVPPCAAAPLCGPRAGLPGENRRGGLFFGGASATLYLHYIFMRITHRARRMQPGAKAAPGADGGIETESAAHRAAGADGAGKDGAGHGGGQDGKTGAPRRGTRLFSRGRARARVPLGARGRARAAVPALVPARGASACRCGTRRASCSTAWRPLVEDGLGALAGRPVALLPETVPWEAQMEAVVINIRLPRILLACLVGCSLSGAGAAYQSVFQNPMAAPDILGASSGAAFGAALAILLGLPARLITLAAFAAGLVTVAAGLPGGAARAGQARGEPDPCGRHGQLPVLGGHVVHQARGRPGQPAPGPSPTG